LFVNAMPRYEILTEDAIEVLDKGWRRIVSELGIEFLLPEAVELLRGAGQTIEGENRVRFDPEFILEQVAKAPREFELQARNPDQSAHIGRSHGVRAVYGCPFIREGDVRRDAKMADFENLVKLANHSGSSTPRAGRSANRGPAARFAPPRHGAGAADAVDKAVHGLCDLGAERGGHDSDGRDPVRRPVGDRASARFDLLDQRKFAPALRRRMLAAMFEYVKANQAVVITPFLLMGAMSPVSLPATLVQQIAEGLAGSPWRS